jgi:hypothetical protein
MWCYTPGHFLHFPRSIARKLAFNDGAAESLFLAIFMHRRGGTIAYCGD